MFRVNDAVFAELILADSHPIGCWSAYTLQKKILGHDVAILGEEVWAYAPDGSQPVAYGKLESVFREAREGLCNVSTSTIRCWFNHFCMFGETPEETRHFRKKLP